MVNADFFIRLPLSHRAASNDDGDGTNSAGFLLFRYDQRNDHFNVLRMRVIGRGLHDTLLGPQEQEQQWHVLYGHAWQGATVVMALELLRRVGRLVGMTPVVVGPAVGEPSTTEGEAEAAEYGNQVADFLVWYARLLARRGVHPIDLLLWR
jgi:hypothetical protein